MPLLILQAHHTRTGEHNLQVGVEVVALTEFTAPVRLFEHLVDQQYTTALQIELTCKFGNAVPLEEEVVHVDIQTLLVGYIKTLLGVLQQESGLANAARTFNTNHAVVPIDLIHQGATNRGIGMLNEVSMRSKKCFHPADLF